MTVPAGHRPDLHTTQCNLSNALLPNNRQDRDPPNPVIGQICTQHSATVATHSYPITGKTVTSHPSHRPDLHTTQCNRSNALLPSKMHDHDPSTQSQAKRAQMQTAPSHRPNVHKCKQHSVTIATPSYPIKGKTMTLHPSHRADLQTRKQHSVTMATPTYPIKGKTMTLPPS